MTARVEIACDAPGCQVKIATRALTATASPGSATSLRFFASNRKGWAVTGNGDFCPEHAVKIELDPDRPLTDGEKRVLAWLDEYGTVDRLRRASFYTTGDAGKPGYADVRVLRSVVDRGLAQWTNQYEQAIEKKEV